MLLNTLFWCINKISKKLIAIIKYIFYVSHDLYYMS